jgi:hypothetical protein
MRSIFVPGGRTVDPETVAVEHALDEAFDNIVAVEPPAPPDDGWIPEEF